MTDTAINKTWSNEPEEAQPGSGAASGSEDFHRRLGITLLDAKWLDPKCHQGCQSLVHKDRIEKLEATLRTVLEWCEQDSPNFEIDADAIRDVLNPKNKD